MKLNRIITLCAMATALALSVGTSFAQQDNGNGNNGGGRRNRGGGNFDPAQFQQRMMDNVRDELGFTNDTDWDAVQPLVQKVMDAQRDARGNQFRGMFGRNRGNRGNRGGQNDDQANQNGGNRGNRGGGFFGQTSPEQDALQKAVDDNAPASQIKDLLAKYRASQKQKQDKLEAAQSDLKKVLSTKQEAEAALMGLVN